MKKKIMVLLAMTLALLVTAFPAAATRRIVRNMEIVVSNIQYMGGGTAVVDIQDACHDSTAITWTGNEKVTVRDSHGNAVPASVSQADNDTVNIMVQNPTAKETYSFQVSHMTVGTHSRVTLTGSFKAIPNWKNGAPEQQTDASGAPKPDIYIGTMTYNGNRLLVDVDTAANRDDPIRWDKTERLTVRDAKGMSYTARTSEESGGRIGLYFVGLKKDETYKVKISNINYDGARYSVDGEFVATEGWTFKYGEKKQ